DRDAQATRDASPIWEPVRGQRPKPPPAHPFSQHGINDIQDPAILCQDRCPSALRCRSPVRRVGALFLEEPKRSVKPLFSRRPTLLRLVSGISADPLSPSRFSAAPASWEPGYRRLGQTRQELFSSTGIFSETPASQ
ncbi:hypothetical protein, partial [Azospirillum brasilense]